MDSTEFLTSIKPHKIPRPCAYLWGRCEGWAKIGVFHGVLVDGERGEVLDEKRNVLLRRGADGLWGELEREEVGSGKFSLPVRKKYLDF